MFVYGQPEVLSPPASPGLGAATYTDSQVAQALRESMAQGFSLLDSIAGVIRVFDVPVDQAYRAGDIVAAETQGKPATGAASLVVTEMQQTTAPTYNDAQVAQALRESMAQGFSLLDSIAGVIRVFNVPVDQAYRAGDIVANEMEAARRAAAAAAAAKAAADAARPTYTDAQVAQALRESMAQGFSLLDSIAGVIRVFNVPVDQAYRAGDIVANEIEAAKRAAAAVAERQAAQAAAAAKAAADAARPTYTDAQVAQALRESIAQGFNLAQSMDAAMRLYGISREQIVRAGNIVANEIEAARQAAADAARRTAAAKAAADAAAAQAARDAAAKAAADAAAEAARKAAADAAAKAAADAAAKAALTVKPTGTRAFTDAEIAQAMRESLKQGFTLKDAVTGAVTKFAVPRDQAIRVAEQIAAETQPTTTTPAQAGIGPLLLAVAAAYLLGA